MKLTMLIYFAFRACWILYHSIAPVNLFLDTQGIKAARDVGMLLGTVNSSVNFIIYGLKNRRLRRCYFSYMRCHSANRVESAA